MITQVRQLAAVWIIDFVGDITKFADQEIQEAYRQIPEQSELFALNFSRCDYINSAGIAVIISLITQARRKKQHVMAYGLTSHYHKLFYMVGLSDYVEICNNESEVIEKATALPPAPLSP
ncbi:MAG: STAS domain-containing protein [Thermoflexales bacterium]|nr:STAS domain-containing protein [Thermoflexales bacterium]